MRVVALIASYNERRFIGPCLEHLHARGVESIATPGEELDTAAPRQHHIVDLQAASSR